MKIRVQIMGDRGEVLRDAALEVSVAREAMRPIDLPSKGCPTSALVFCTPAAQRIQTESFRKELAQALTDDFLAFFASQDTEMGYHKN